MLRGKERILIALRNGKDLVLGHVQRLGQSLTVHCQVVWNEVDLDMVVVTLAPLHYNRVRSHGSMGIFIIKKNWSVYTPLHYLCKACS